MALTDAQIQAMQTALKGMGTNLGSTPAPPVATLPVQAPTTNTPAPQMKQVIGPTANGIPLPTATKNAAPAPVAPIATPAPSNASRPGPFPTYDSNGKITAIAQGSNGIPVPVTPTPPAFDPKAIAASRIAEQRAALAGSVNAYDAQRKAAYDYANKTTSDNRVLAAGMFKEQNDPFSGLTNYKEANTLRSNNLEDANANTNYQNDIAASDAKLAAFDAGAPGMQQDIENQLNQQQFQNNIAQAGVTGQYNGMPTYKTQQDTITNNRNAANDSATYTGNYISPENAALLQKQQENSAAYATASPAEQIKLHDANLAIAKQLGETYDSNTGTYSGGNYSTRTVAGQTLDQLNDPNSPKNQAAKIDLQLKQIDLANAPKEAKLKIEEMQKRIDQIGAAPYRSPEELQKDKLEVQKLQAEVTNLQNKPAKVQYVDPKVSSDNHATISQDLKGATSADEANQLIEANRNVLTDADYKDLKKQVIDKF